MENQSQQFLSKIEEKVALGMERIEAVKVVARTYPQLHKAYLLATNDSKTAKRLIDEKYDDGDK